MDSSGFKALAFLQTYLCGMVAGVVGYTEGRAAFDTIIAAAVILTSSVLTALWFHEWRAGRGDASPAPAAFAPAVARGAVLAGWGALLATTVTGSAVMLYAGYGAMVVCMLGTARVLQAREGHGRLGYEA